MYCLPEALADRLSDHRPDRSGRIRRWCTWAAIPRAGAGGDQSFCRRPSPVAPVMAALPHVRPTLPTPLRPVSRVFRKQTCSPSLPIRHWLPYTGLGAERYRLHGHAVLLPQTLREVRLRVATSPTEAQIQSWLAPVFEAVSELHAHCDLPRHFARQYSGHARRRDRAVFDLGAGYGRCSLAA